ncbi:Zinc finger, PARP-type [Phytophthora cactorum]|nr:Zinc finger, PARP-type [Phytophthora cactorum]
MATQMDQLPQVPPPGTSPRSSNSWSRCDQAVARVAPIATTTCQVCSKCIAKGEWQLGLMFIHVEGFMLMEWYHLQCSKSLQGSGWLARRHKMDIRMDELPQVPPPGTTSPRSSLSSSWRRCEHPVARIAPIATTTCQVCSKCIAKGDWQLGLMFIHVEGIMIMEWYHPQCSESLQGSDLTDVLQTVQSEMTPEQKKEFQLAFQKVASP